MEKGGEGMKTGNLDSLINDLYQVVYDSGEFATTASSLTITGLKGNTDKEYKLICRFIDDTTVGDYKLTFNTDTGNNYGYQDIKGINTDKSAARDTSEAYIHIGQTATDDYICFSETDIYAVSGNERTAISTYAYDITGTTVTGIIQRGSVWSNTADEITQMVITATADNINAGSRIILLKKVDATAGQRTGALDIEGSVEGAWENIYTTTFASTASSLTITGLTGNTDVLYKLMFRGVDSATIGDYKLTFNTDTGTNYGVQ